MLQKEMAVALRPYIAERLIRSSDWMLLCQLAVEAEYSGRIQVSVSGMAGQLGMNRVTASRGLKRLKHLDLIRVGRIGIGGFFYMVNPELFYAGADKQRLMRSYLALEGPQQALQAA